jgi:hypothetical protein
MRHAAHMEWIKLRSLRSVVWAVLATIVFVAAAGIVAGVYTRDPHGDPTNNMLAGLIGAQIVFAVLGVLVITGEYTTGTISATLAAIPRRPLVLIAKVAVFGLAALAAGELATFAAVAIGSQVLRSGVPAASLSQPAVLRAVALSGAYLCLIGLIGLGLGTIVRHSAPAIATLVGIVFALPLIIGDAARGTGKLFPELIVANSLAAVKPVARFSWSPWTELAIVAGYAAITLVIGRWLLVRRDA